MNIKKDSSLPLRIGDEIGWMVGSKFDCYNHWIEPTYFRGVVELVRSDFLIVSGRQVDKDRESYNLPKTRMLTCPLDAVWIRFNEAPRSDNVGGL